MHSNFVNQVFTLLIHAINLHFPKLLLSILLPFSFKSQCNARQPLKSEAWTEEMQILLLAYVSMACLITTPLQRKSLPSRVATPFYLVEIRQGFGTTHCPHLRVGIILP